MDKFNAGSHVPAIPLSDEAGSTKFESFWHTGEIEVKSGTSRPLHVIEKLLLEISKNVWAPDMTMILAVLDTTLGQTITSEPSLAVDADKTYG